MASRDRNDGRLKNRTCRRSLCYRASNRPSGMPANFFAILAICSGAASRLPYGPGVQSSRWTPCFPVGGREREQNSKGPARYFTPVSGRKVITFVRPAISGRRDSAAIRSARKAPRNHNDRLALAHAFGLDPSNQLSSLQSSECVK